MRLDPITPKRFALGRARAPPTPDLAASAGGPSPSATPFPGGHGALVPPDPIPNSEVKRCIADDSVGPPHVKVGHRQGLIPKPPPSSEGGGFCLIIFVDRIHPDDWNCTYPILRPGIGKEPHPRIEMRNGCAAPDAHIPVLLRIPLGCQRAGLFP